MTNSQTVVAKVLAYAQWIEIWLLYAVPFGHYNAKSSVSEVKVELLELQQLDTAAGQSNQLCRRRSSKGFVSFSADEATESDRHLNKVQGRIKCSDGVWVRVSDEFICCQTVAFNKTDLTKSWVKDGAKRCRGQIADSWFLSSSSWLSESSSELAPQICISISANRCSTWTHEDNKRKREKNQERKREREMKRKQGNAKRRKRKGSEKGRERGWCEKFREREGLCGQKK